MYSATSQPDPYHIKEYDNPVVRGFNNTRGYTQADPRPVDGEDTAVIILIGQSNNANHASGFYTVTQGRNHNFNIYDGGVYQTKSTLLGCGGGNDSAGNNHHWAARLGDKLIAQGVYERVILAPISIGNTPISAWETGGFLNHRIIVLCKRLIATGLTPTMILQHHGESDAVLGTTAAAYTASLNSAISTFRAYGVSAPYFIALASGDSDVRTGQATAVNNSAGVYAGPDADTVTGRYDGLHWNASGADEHADLWVSTIQDYLS
jgi:hypothetical protein